jgi:hypothetical protein
MGFFSLVETFFFISLAITFVLIMMIVYHFKERLTTLEQKTTTITDIMNNFLKELGYLKAAITHVSQTSFRGEEQNREQYRNIVEERAERQKLVVSDTEYSDEEFDEDSDEDSEPDSDDYESDSESEFEEIPVVKHIQIHSISDDISEEFDENLNFEEYANDHLYEEQQEDIGVIEDIEEIELHNSDTLEIEVNNYQELPDEITIKKIENVLEEPSPIIHKMVNPTEVYRKMEISELRSLVIQQGLATDTKKLKKMDLIRLLTNTD